MKIFDLPENNTRQMAVKAILLTLVVVAVALAIRSFPIHLEPPSLTSEDAGAYDIYDLYYEGSDRGKDTRDENIVLVQIAETREEITRQLQAISSFHPAVVGLDVLFESPRDPETDKNLFNAIKNTNCVSATRYAKKDSLFYEQSSFFNNSSTAASEGFINFYPSQSNDWPVVRTFLPFIEENYSFAARIVEKYDPDKLKLLRMRDRNAEIIRYTGMLQHYSHFDAQMFLSSDTIGQLAEKIKDKIILVGYFLDEGQPMVLADRHYTPMNETLAGKSPPDTYGVVIHANIISMILAGNYIYQLPVLITWFLAAVLVFIHLYIHMVFSKKDFKMPSLVEKLIRFGVMLLIVWICLMLFSQYRIRVPLFPIVFLLVVKEIYRPLLEGIHNTYLKIKNRFNKIIAK